MLKQGGSRPKRDEPPLFTVVTVCRNAIAHLEVALQSVATQSIHDWEYIVIDGGSTDGTVELLQRHNTLITYWQSAPDAGIYDAMNQGAALARGTYLSFLNADDSYLPDTLHLVHDRLRAHPADVVHGNMIKVRELPAGIFEREERPDASFLPQGMGVFHPTVFMSTAVFRKLGGFNMRYRVAADYDLLLRAWLNGHSFETIDKPLALFSIGGISNADCTAFAEAAEIQRTLQTGAARKTHRLWWKCRLKKALRQIVFTLARLTGTTGQVEKTQQRRWQS